MFLPLHTCIPDILSRTLRGFVKFYLLGNEQVFLSLRSSQSMQPEIGQTWAKSKKSKWLFRFTSLFWALKTDLIDITDIMLIRRKMDFLKTPIFKYLCFFMPLGCRDWHWMHWIEKIQNFLCLHLRSYENSKCFQIYWWLTAEEEGIIFQIKPLKVSMNETKSEIYYVSNIIISFIAILLLHFVKTKIHL